MHASNDGIVGMEDGLVLTGVSGHVGSLRINRPRQRNALSDAVMDALGDALLAFDGNPDVRVIVLSGDAKAFAAGADIAAMANWTYMDVFQNDFITRNWEVIRRIRKPVIAAVAGYAIGGGCELALACDIVIAADNARFAVPEIKLAMMPGAGGTQRLPRAVGKAKAMDMCLSGRTLTAEEADRYGLVSRVVPADMLEHEAMALAAEIATYSLPALLAIKDSISRAYESSLAEGLAYERRQLHARFASADAHEGMSAFLEKRPPQFRHC
ncbi:MAG: enoyl-CoA hydratase-related protein [Burkholderiaceae bacterium]